MLINCAAYQEGHKLSDIPKEDISEYLERPNCFVWVGLKDPEPSELEEMRQEFGLHELASFDDARAAQQRPKIEEYGDSLFAVLKSVEPHEGRASGRRSRHFRGQQLHPVGAQKRERIRRRAQPLGARASLTAVWVRPMFSMR
jgi:magnesium transporter